MRNLFQKGLNLFSSKRKNPFKILYNDIKTGLLNTKFEEKLNEPKEEKNVKEIQKVITRIKNIFVSKTNCSKFNYHPLINYTIGKYGDYSLYLKTIFVEISYYKNNELKKIEKTYFNPNSKTFGVNFQNLTFIFYMNYSNVQIILDFKEYYNISASPDLKKIRKNYIDLSNNKNNIINNSNLENSIKFNSTIDYSLRFNNNDGLKNSFEETKEKINGFSCINHNNIYEIKYGFNKIGIDGFYEIRDDIKLPYKNPKNIYIPKKSLAFLEIKMNCEIKYIKNEIHRKIQILKLLGLSYDKIFFLGILYNNNKIENEEEEKMYFEEDNFKIYIFNCKAYFLGQKITLVKRVFSDEITNTPININNIDQNKNDINERVLSVNKSNTRNINLGNHKTENLNEVKYNDNKLNNKINNINKPLSGLKSLSNFSLFDDDILYSQMIFG